MRLKDLTAHKENVGKQFNSFAISEQQKMNSDGISTHRITDGQTVTLDGGAGAVELLERTGS